jgi:hypothetical protein
VRCFQYNNLWTPLERALLAADFWDSPDQKDPHHHDPPHQLPQRVVVVLLRF